MRSINPQETLADRLTFSLEANTQSKRNSAATFTFHGRISGCKKKNQKKCLLPFEVRARKTGTRAHTDLQFTFSRKTTLICGATGAVSPCYIYLYIYIFLYGPISLHNLSLNANFFGSPASVLENFATFLCGFAFKLFCCPVEADLSGWFFSFPWSLNGNFPSPMCCMWFSYRFVRFTRIEFKMKSILLEVRYKMWHKWKNQRGF